MTKPRDESPRAANGHTRTLVLAALLVGLATSQTSTASPLITGSPANAGDNNWNVVAAGEYGIGAGGFPGTKDIVWRNATSGNLVVWHMDQAGNRTSGLFATPIAPTPNPTDWTVVGPR